MQELSILTALSKSMEQKFINIEKYYKELSGAQKKLKLQLSIHSPADDVTSIPDVVPHDNEVIQFHVLADQYIDTFKELQDLIVLKQSEIIPKQESINSNAHIGETHDVTPGADIDLLAGLTRPVWLDILMLKYSRHMSGRASAPASTEKGTNYPHCDPLNLGSFCAFLSCCLVGRVAVVVQEHQALIEVYCCSAVSFFP